MRVAVGAMKHESNTFTDRTTGTAAFQPVQGDNMYEREDWDESASMGIIDELERQGHEVILTQFAHALPDGIVEEDAHKKLKDGIIDGIEAADTVDAICLDLHGSMYAADESDPEGALLATLRDKVGDAVPIVSSLDMHATVTEQMVDAADGFTAYRTAPHTDVYETGVRAAKLLCTIAEGVDPIVERIRLPMLLAGEQSETDAEPMRGLIEYLEEVEDSEHILSTSYMLGFPWADSPHNGVYAVVVGDRAARESVEDACEKLAAAFWRHHEQFIFTTPAHDFDDALDEAIAESRSPVVIADSGDNPTAGASEHSSFVVERLVERGVEDALVAVVADEDTVTDAERNGIGSQFQCELGYTAPVRKQDPFCASTTVFDTGTAAGIDSAILDIQGVTVVVTAERTAVYDPTFLTELGLELDDYSVVVVKSGYLSPEYQDIASRALLGLTPGETNELIDSLPFESVPRPIYPLDEDISFEPVNDP